MTAVLQAQLQETLRQLAIAEARIGLALADPTASPSVRSALTAEPMVVE